MFLLLYDKISTLAPLNLTAFALLESLEGNEQCCIVNYQVYSSSPTMHESSAHLMQEYHTFCTFSVVAAWTHAWEEVLLAIGGILLCLFEQNR
jgi:hypothetical protein